MPKPLQISLPQRKLLLPKPPQTKPRLKKPLPSGAAAFKAAQDRAAAEKAAAEKAAAEKAAAAAAIKKGVVQIRSLRIRADHTTKSGLVGGLVKGDEVTILETWTDGKDTWAKIGPDQWAAVVFEGETYIKMV